MSPTSLDAAVRTSIQTQCAKLMQLLQLYEDACGSVYKQMARERVPKAKLIPRSAGVRVDSIKTNADNLRQAALSDATIGAMSSLIDHYAMFCAVRIGAPQSDLTHVQHDWIRHPELQLNGAKARKNQLSSAFDEFRQARKDKPTAPYDFWLELYTPSIVRRLKALKVELNQERCKKLPGEPLKQVVDYFELIWPFVSNPLNGNGLRFKLYVDLNNVFKHNINHDPKRITESFGTEHRYYTYIEIPNSSRPFVKEGLLQNLMLLDFNQLRDWLAKSQHEPMESCPIAQALDIDQLISIDAENGFISADQTTLYFFIDSVLVGKHRHGILIDAGNTLCRTARGLCEAVSRGVEMKQYEELPCSP